MPTQTELILRVQALGTEQIDKLGKMLDGLEKTTEQWSNAQQRAAMAASGLQDRAKQMNEEFNRQSNVMANLMPAIGAFSVAIAAVGYGFMRALTSATDYVEGLEKANQQTGVSIDLWQKLIKTGAEMNVSFDQIRGAVEKMERAVEGDGKALAKFGIDVEKFKSLAPDEMFRAMAAQIIAIQDPAERAAVAMAVFGKSGAEIIPMLVALTDGSVDAQRAMGPEMVQALSGTDRALDGLKTAWGELWTSMVGFIAVKVPLELFFNLVAEGIRKIADDGLRNLTAQWIGAGETLAHGWAAGLVAMEAYRASTQKATTVTHGTSKAVLELKETSRQLAQGLDKLVDLWGQEAKAEDKASAVIAKHRLAMAADAKAAQDRALVVVAASEKQLEAEQKRMAAEIAGEKDVTAQFRDQQAQQFLAGEEKYRKLAAESARYFQHVIDGVTRSSETEVQQAQRVLQEVTARRQALVESHRASNEEMFQADQAMAAAEKALDEAESQRKKELFFAIAEAASTILRTLFGKSKAAAIAAAIIDAAAAIVKVFAQLGWWGIPMAAAIAVKTGAEIAKIRNQQPGFAQGTPGTSFVDFGRGSMQMLHGQEAVVTRGQADSVAAMVRGAIDDANRRGGDRGSRGSSRGSGEAAIVLDGEVVGRWFVRRNRAGLLPVMVR